MTPAPNHKAKLKFCSTIDNDNKNFPQTLSTQIEECDDEDEEETDFFSLFKNRIELEESAGQSFFFFSSLLRFSSIASLIHSEALGTSLR